MRKIFRVLRDTFVSRKFIRFCLLGIINTFNASWISHFAERILQANLAATVGYVLSLVGAYFLSCFFIFKTRCSWLGFARFLLSYVPHFILYFLTTFVTINTLHLPQFWATAVAVVIGGPLTFLIMRFYAFGKKPVTEAHEEDTE